MHIIVYTYAMSATRPGWERVSRAGSAVSLTAAARCGRVVATVSPAGASVLLGGGVPAAALGPACVGDTVRPLRRALVRALVPAQVPALVPALGACKNLEAA